MISSVHICSGKYIQTRCDILVIYSVKQLVPIGSIVVPS